MAARKQVQSKSAGSFTLLPELPWMKKYRDWFKAEFKHEATQVRLARDEESGQLFCLATGAYNIHIRPAMSLIEAAKRFRPKFGFVKVFFGVEGDGDSEPFSVSPISETLDVMDGFHTQVSSQKGAVFRVWAEGVGDPTPEKTPTDGQLLASAAVVAFMLSDTSFDYGINAQVTNLKYNKLFELMSTTK